MPLPSKLFAGYLLVLGSVGCFLHNADREVLAALVPDPGTGWFANEHGIQADYLAFDDALTASLLKGLERKYRIAPAGTPLLCPTNRPRGMHGFNVRLRVAERRGSQALAEMERRCQHPLQTLVTVNPYLLTRRNGSWRVAKVFDGSLTWTHTPRKVFSEIGMERKTKSCLGPDTASVRIIAKIQRVVTGTSDGAVRGRAMLHLPALAASQVNLVTDEASCVRARQVMDSLVRATNPQAPSPMPWRPIYVLKLGTYNAIADLNNRTRGDVMLGFFDPSWAYLASIPVHLGNPW